MTARGIYVAQFSAPADPATLADERIAGEMHTYRWSQVEPEKGVFNFTRLDADLAVARRYNKQLSVGILSGASTPPHAASVAAGNAIEMVIASHGGLLGSGQTVDIPITWDPMFQAAVEELAFAVSTHIEASGNLDLVSQIKLTGVTEQTEETRMPCEPVLPLTQLDGRKVAAFTSDATALWLAHGYRRNLAEQACHRLAHVWASAFRGIEVCMPVILIGGFPAIDTTGAVVGAPSSDVITTSDLVLSSAASWHERFRVMSNALSGTYNATNKALLVTAANEYGARVGFQFSNILFGPSALPDVAGADAGALAGLALGADYFEVHRNWRFDYSEVLDRLHTALG